MSESIHFGEFELSAERFELRRHGERVHVQPKVLRLLLHLAEHRSRAVSRTELLSAVWPGETVTLASVKRAVQGARRVLGDAGEHRASIRTVGGHGYQFVLPATEPDAPRAPGRNAFVGREDVLHVLDESLTDLAAGQGRLVLLVGGPGLGKTRTLEELARRAARNGVEAWLGRCLEAEGAPPFWPWLQVVRDCIRLRGEQQTRTLMGTEAAEILEAVADRDSLLRDVPAAPAIEGARARFRLFDGMTTFLKRSAERQPLALLFDDLHRADQATLHMLLFVARHVFGSRLLVFGTLRRQQESQTAALLDALTREDPARCLELQGFDHETTSRYVETVTGMRAPCAVVHALHERTAGNPLFVRQLLQCALSPASDGLEPRWDRLAGMPASEGLRGAIARHIDALSAATRDLLSVASVLGREFSSSALAEVAQISVESAFARLSEAVLADVVEAAPQGIGKYRFTHGLIQEVLYDQLDPPNRARLHGLAASTLEGWLPCADHALLSEVAHHLLRAAPLHDRGRALECCSGVARLAMQRLAFEEAAARFGDCLELLDFEGNTDPRLRMSLLLERAEALARTASSADCRACLLQVVNLARQLDDADILARAAELFAAGPQYGGVDPVQVGLLQDALTRLPPCDPRRPRLTALLSRSLSFSGDLERAAGLALAALAGARRVVDPVVRARALETCHAALTEPRHLSQRLAVADELDGIARSTQNTEVTLWALLSRIECAVELGSMATVDAALARLDPIADKLREPLYRWHSKVVRSMRAYVGGNLPGAVRLAEEALELGACIGEAPARHAFCVQAAGPLWVLGRVGEADALVRETSARWPELRGWRAVLACFDFDLGRRDAARRVLDELLEDGLTGLLRDPYALSALCPFADLVARVGDEAAARVAYDALAPFSEQHGVVAFGVGTYGPVTTYLGHLAARLGERALAEQHYGDALRRAEQMPSPTFAILARLAHARLLTSSGAAEERHRAAELLKCALGAAKQAQIPGLVATCERMHQRL